MEMHQIRYFLAVSRTLNFSRAAEDCHVAQSSLTRAIKLLEAELGGDLFRRERNLTHLTDFGQRMLPLLRRCHDSALSAKQLASSIKSGAFVPLTLALSQAVSLSVLTDPLVELTRVFPGLELRFLRGTAAEVIAMLKKGEAVLALAGPVGEPWDRLEAWPLFTERLDLVVGKNHRFATLERITMADLARDRFLLRSYCEVSASFVERMASGNTTWRGQHEAVNDQDMLELVRCGLGVSLLPRSTPAPADMRRVGIEHIELRRTISLYAASGRERAAPATALMRLLRAREWAMAARDGLSPEPSSQS
jgi:DNA-binding transcriptional LysR family regulator